MLPLCRIVLRAIYIEAGVQESHFECIKSAGGLRVWARRRARISGGRISLHSLHFEVEEPGRSNKTHSPGAKESLREDLNKEAVGKESIVLNIEVSTLPGRNTLLTEQVTSSTTGAKVR